MACKPERVPLGPPPPEAHWEVDSLRVDCASDLWSVNDVWVRPDGALVAIVSGRRVVTYRQNQWECVYVREGGLAALWADDSHIFAVGDTAIGEFTVHELVVHYDGAQWNESVLGNPGGLHTLTCVWGRSRTKVYAGGYFGARWAFDGSTWVSMTQSGSSVETSIHGNDQLVIMAGEYNDQVAYRECMLSVQTEPDGIFVNETCAGEERIIDVIALDGDHAVAIGINQVLERTPAGIWEPMSIVGGGNSVWGTDIENVFVAGGSTILHYDGHEWTPFSSPVAWSVRMLAGTSLSTLVAFGDSNAEYMRYVVPR